tara:strand:- start:147 stop:542 length:396 start_codon:yes stop_codon:yes gene_type:complete
MSDSFINASNIRSFDTTKKYNEPSIVIWNNGGSKVAFVGNDNEAKTYLYNDECFTKIINNNHITERIYDAGPHSKICDTLKNGKAIYIEKLETNGVNWVILCILIKFTILIIINFIYIQILKSLLQIKEMH